MQLAPRLAIAAFVLTWGAVAAADPKSAPDTGTSGKPVEVDDPTGGAYTSPTLLFIPAGAVPAWNVRVIASTTLQSPSDVHAGFRPGLGAEVGLGHGITIGAGTNWVGGDVNPDNGKADFLLGLSPYFQARMHLVGADDGMGWQLGTGVAYKFVGFGGGTNEGQDPGEAELNLSLQYRRSHYEAGLQGALGQDFGDSRNHDGELHAYALYRVIPELGLGAAGQVRMAIAPEANDPKGPPAYTDIIGGAMGSLTLGHYQVGLLAGASTIGIAPTRPSSLARAGAVGQAFGTFRF